VRIGLLEHTVNGERVKILLIEDDSGDAFLIQEMLAGVTDAIFEQQWCRTLSSGIEYMSSGQPVDVILLDLTLPDSSGLATLHGIKNINDRIPVIILTGMSSEEIAYQAVSKGAQDFLVKGRFNSDSLSRSIRYSIQRQKLFSDLMDVSWHLQMSEMRFRDIFESNADGIVIVGPDEKILMANQSALELFGRTAEELAYVPFGHPLVPGQFSEIEILRPDSSSVFVEMRTTQTVFEGRQAFLATLRDISDRRLSEMKTRNLNAILNVMRKISRIMLSTRDLRVFLQSICNTFVETRGYGSAWIVRTGQYGEYLELFSAGSDADMENLVAYWLKARMPECAKQVLIHGGVEYLEESLPSCNADCPFNCRRSGMGTISARLEHAGNIYGFLKISIPEGFVMHEEEKELFGEMASSISYAIYSRDNEVGKQDQESRIRQMALIQDQQIDSSGVWLNVIDPHGGIMVWNKTAEIISGYMSDEVVGRSVVWDWLYPDAAEKDRIVGHIRRIIEEGKGFDSLETHIRTRNGDTRCIAWHLRNLSDEYGETVGAIMLGRDVTEHRQAEDDLRRTTQWLKKITMPGEADNQP